MPNDPSVYVRYMWYLRLLTYNGFVVLIDNHLNSDPTITKDVNLWVQVRITTSCEFYATGEDRQRPALPCPALPCPAMPTERTSMDQFLHACKFTLRLQRTGN